MQAVILRTCEELSFVVENASQQLKLPLARKSLLAGSWGSELVLEKS